MAAVVVRHTRGARSRVEARDVQRRRKGVQVVEAERFAGPASAAAGFHSSGVNHSHIAATENVSLQSDDGKIGGTAAGKDIVSRLNIQESHRIRPHAAGDASPPNNWHRPPVVQADAPADKQHRRVAPTASSAAYVRASYAEDAWR